MIRFATRLGWTVHPDIHNALHEHPDIASALGRKISRERIGSELTGMMEGPNPVMAWKYLFQHALHTVVFASASTESIDWSSTSAVMSAVWWLNFGIHSPLRVPTASLRTVWQVQEVFDADTRRVIHVSSMLSACKSFMYEERGKQYPVSTRILRDDLKLKKKDWDHVSSIHKSCNDLSVLISSGRRSRSDIGLWLKDAGPTWYQAVLLSAAIVVAHAVGDSLIRMNEGDIYGYAMSVHLDVRSGVCWMCPNSWPKLYNS